MAMAIDAALSRALRAISALSGLESRQLDPTQLTPAELTLEAEWSEQMRPILEDLHWYPLRNGLTELPEDDAELQSWIERQYENDVAIVAALLALLVRFLTRGANVGGQVALAFMGLDGTFSLTNAGLLADLEAHAGDLVATGTELNLVDTTARDLARIVTSARADDGDTLRLVATAIRARSEVRSTAIAETELSHAVATAQTWTYARNGVRLRRFQTREDDRVCEICEPLNGVILPVDSTLIWIPLHPRCRCWWVPILEDWAPETIVWLGD